MKLRASFPLKLPTIVALTLSFVALLAAPSGAQARTSFGDGADDGKRLYFGVGMISEDMGQYSVDAGADSTSLFATMYVDLSLSARLRLGSTRWFFTPAVSYTPLGVSSPDGQETTHLLTGGLRLTRPVGPVDLTLGPGLLHRTTSASGGTVTLNNGSGMASFGVPPSGTSMNLFYWDAGVGFGFKGFRADLNVLVTDLFGARRAYDGMATVSYGIF
jgi:hypothetical protein